MLSSIFVDRPRLAIVIAIVTTLAGALSLLFIPVAQYPDIVPPQVSVTTSYPGASAAIVDATIAQPIEAQVVGVDKMIYMKSVSGNDGSYTLTASFELGTDPDINTVNVNNRVQVALSKLPQDVQRQGVTVKKQSSALLGVIAVYSPKGTLDPLFISNYATINLIDQIKATRGVGDASLWGPQDYAMRAWVQTDKLTGMGLTTGDVIDAIQAQNVQAAVGRIGARPISDDQRLQLNIQTKGRLDSVADFENIVIRTNPDGSILRLRDVGRVELGAANLDRETRLNGQPAAALAVYQSPGANAIETMKSIRGQMTALAKSFPGDLAWKVTYDPTTFVTATIHEVEKTLVEAFILVVLVVFLFLGSFRATLIPSIAVPVSLIGAFIVLYAIGYSANSVSLLAVVLAIGIVVDDAIVVVENVERVMEEHPELSPAQATKQAMREITAPIIAITLVLLSVFVPVGFIPGISGELFRQFAVTVAVAMFLSAINALTLSPALCAILLKPHCGPRGGITGWVMRSIDRVRDAYGTAAARLVRVSIVGLVFVAASMLGIVGLSKITPTGFLPEDDQGGFFVVVQLPGGASVARTSSTVEKTQQILAQEKSISDTTSITGFNFIDNYSQSNSAFFVVTLKPFEERKSKRESVDAIIERVNAKLREIQGGSVISFPPPPIIGLGTGGGFTYVLKDLTSGDPKLLAQVVRGLQVAANQDPMLERVFSTFSATDPSVYLDIDRDKAQVLGVPLSSVFQALQASLGGFYVNDMNLFGRTWQVQVQAEASDRASVDDIFRINVRNAQGKMIPLRSLVEPRVIVGPPALIRFNNKRAVTVQGNARAGSVVWASVGCHGGGGRAHSASRFRRRVDGYGFPGEAGRRENGYHSWFRPAVCLLVPGSTLRKLDHPGAGSALGLGWRIRRIPRDAGCRVDAGSLCADRHGRSHRPCRQERHSDCRIREGEARAWRAAPGERHRRRAPQVPPGHDDIARVHIGAVSACRCERGIGTRTARRWHPGFRRNAACVFPWHFRHPAALCDLPVARGAVEQCQSP